jgi:delta(3,5)-delta(2,4)-dienoyl-CoA isomerase
MSYSPRYFLVDEPAPFVRHVQIARAEKLNAFIEPMWLEFGALMDRLSTDPDVRAVVLSGAGRHFTSGLDVEAASQAMAGHDGGDVARTARRIQRAATAVQSCVAAAERCEVPVVCVLHGHALGLAIDLACCADVRVCAADARMAVKEVDVGMAADVGTLARLPKLVGSFGWVKEVCLGARAFGPAEALRQGFVSAVYESKEAAVAAAVELARAWAAKSPVAVSNTKDVLNRARDQSIEESEWPRRADR